MWNLVSGKNTSGGLQGYEIKKKYLDPLKMKQGKENFEMAVNKKKRPKPKKLDMSVKRGDILE